MTQAEFSRTAPQIRAARANYSVADCQSSSGGKRSFYQCMANGCNHVLGCARQFKH